MYKFIFSLLHPLKDVLEKAAASGCENPKKFDMRTAFLKGSCEWHQFNCLLEKRVFTSKWRRKLLISPL